MKKKRCFVFLGKNPTNFFRKSVCMHLIQPTAGIHHYSSCKSQSHWEAPTCTLYGVRILTLSLHLKPTTPWPPFQGLNGGTWTNSIHALIDIASSKVVRLLKAESGDVQFLFCHFHVNPWTKAGFFVGL